MKGSKNFLSGLWPDYLTDPRSGILIPAPPWKLIDGMVININKLECPIKTQLPSVIILSSFSNHPTYTSFGNTVLMVS